MEDPITKDDTAARIQEILEQHRPTAEHYCGACPQWTPPDEDLDAVHSMNDVDWFMRAHVSQILEKHLQEQVLRGQVAALNSVARTWQTMQAPGPHHLFSRMLQNIADNIEKERNLGSS